MSDLIEAPVELQLAQGAALAEQFEPGIRGDRAALFSALIKAQAAFTPIGKTENNPHFNKPYAPLSEVVKATDPALHANDLGFIQAPDDSGGELVLWSVLIHGSGAYWATRMKIREFRNMQEFGGIVTYAKRYVRLAMLGVAPEDAEDDDGNSAPTFDDDRPPRRQQDKPPSPRQAEGRNQQRPPTQPRNQQPPKSDPAPARPAGHPWDPEPTLADDVPVRYVNKSPRPLLRVMMHALEAAVELGAISLNDGEKADDAGVRFVRATLKRDDLNGMTVGDARTVVSKIAELGVEVPNV